MNLPTSGTIWLETSYYGNGEYAQVARSKTDTVLTVVHADYDHNNYLARLFQHLHGDTPLVVAVEFSGPREREYLHYHPGARNLSEQMAWDILRTLWSVGRFIKIVAELRSEHEDPGKAHLLPQDIRLMAASRSVAHTPERILAVHRHLRDSRAFPVEGYYYDQPEPELLITGKIRAADFR